MIHDITSAVQQLSLATISEFHKSASSSVQSNAFCCATTIADVRRGILNGRSEEGGKAKADLVSARRMLQRNMSSAPNAGSHLWPVLEVPSTESGIPSVDEGVYFKLFLKFCYRRTHIGELHEFSVGNICRRCGLNLGKPLDLIDFNTEGASILASQQGDLQIEVTADSFIGLSDAIRRRKLIRPAPSAKQTTWKEGLVRFASYISKSEPLKNVGTVLTSILAEMDSLKGPIDELTRVSLWEPLISLYDTLGAGIADQIGPLVPSQPGKMREARAREAILALSIFESITKDPFVEGPRVVQEYWCTKAFATGNNFSITSVNGAKWFHISQEHNAKLNTLLTENANWFQGDTSIQSVKNILKHIANTLGPLIRMWIQMVRPSGDEESVWNTVEAQYLLRTCIYQVWYDAVMTNSWMYSDINVENERVVSAGIVANWTRGLMLHIKQHYIKYSKEEIALRLQQRAELERTSIVEEFGSAQDDDTRAAELLMKKFRIGRWAMGKNIQKYDPEMYEFENEQRSKMGAIDPPVDPSLVPIVEVAGEDYGLGGGGGPEEGYDVVQDNSDDV